MRYIGAAMILASSACLGFIFSRSKKRHIEALRGMCGAFEIMAGELETRITPIPEVCVLLSKRCTGTAENFFTDLAASLDSLGDRDFAELWTAAAEKSLAVLNAQELDEVLALGNIIGRYELSEQTRALHICLNTLRTALDTAQREYPGEKKLGLGLTTAAGVLLIVVLL